MSSRSKLGALRSADSVIMAENRNDAADRCGEVTKLPADQPCRQQLSLEPWASRLTD